MNAVHYTEFGQNGKNLVSYLQIVVGFGRLFSYRSIGVFVNNDAFLRINTVHGNHCGRILALTMDLIVDRHPIL